MGQFRDRKRTPGLISQLQGNRVQIDKEHIPTGKKSRGEGRTEQEAQLHAKREMYRKLGTRNQ